MIGNYHVRFCEKAGGRKWPSCLTFVGLVVVGEVRIYFVVLESSDVGAGASPDSPVTTVAAPRVLQPGEEGVPSPPLGGHEGVGGPLPSPSRRGENALPGKSCW